jgi:hypothetical protein
MQDGVKRWVKVGAPLPFPPASFHFPILHAQIAMLDITDSLHNNSENLQESLRYFHQVLQPHHSQQTIQLGLLLEDMHLPRMFVVF